MGNTRMWTLRAAELDCIYIYHQTLYLIGLREFVFRIFCPTQSINWILAHIFLFHFCRISTALESGYFRRVTLLSCKQFWIFGIKTHHSWLPARLLWVQGHHLLWLRILVKPLQETLDYALLISNFPTVQFGFWLVCFLMYCCLTLMHSSAFIIKLVLAVPFYFSFPL